ncbi:MAG: hypothetical protein P8Y02_08160 [Deinococcales bacterium]
MRRLLFSLVLVLASAAFAQQSAELSGIVKSEQALPDGTRVAVHVVDNNNVNGVFDRVTDPWFIGVPSLEKPVGFFSLLYVDRDTVLTGGGATLQLKKGWNIFTVRFPGDKPVYAVQSSVNDISLDVFLP